MKKVFWSTVFISVLNLFLISCASVPFFETPQGPEEVFQPAPETVAPPVLQPLSILPKSVRVLLKTVKPTQAEYASWNQALGTAKQKTLTWRDAQLLPSGKLSLAKDGFGLEGKKYPGILVAERGKNSAILLINEVDIETYLRGVVPSEMQDNWPVEALKAQAVCARTYALYTLVSFSGLLDNSVADQVYKGTAFWRPTSDRAVLGTQGEVLVFDKKIFPSYFHSASGGQTATVPLVWPKKENIPAITSVRDPYSLSCPLQNWRTELSPAELDGLLTKAGYNFRDIKALQVLRRDPTGRVMQVQVAGKFASRTFSGNDFRMMLGWKILRSTLFEITFQNGKFVFLGHGFGHGVGMSQWGAKAMADRGFKYAEILKFYFPKTDLTQIERALPPDIKKTA